MTVATIIYIEKDQRDLIQEIYPQQMSSLVREFLDILLMGKSLNESDLSPELTAKLLMHREKQKSKQTFLKEREQLKASLFDYLTSHHIPEIFARRGKRAASKAAREWIIGFRQKGFNLPEYLVFEFLPEYLDYIECSGVVDEAWKNYKKREAIK